MSEGTKEEVSIVATFAGCLAIIAVLGFLANPAETVAYLAKLTSAAKQAYHIVTD